MNEYSLAKVQLFHKKNLQKFGNFNNNVYLCHVQTDNRSLRTMVKGRDAYVWKGVYILIYIVQTLTLFPAKATNKVFCRRGAEQLKT